MHLDVHFKKAKGYAIRWLSNYSISFTLSDPQISWFWINIYVLFSRKNKRNGKNVSSNIKFSHSCKSWKKIFWVFSKNLCYENETISCKKTTTVCYHTATLYYIRCCCRVLSFYVEYTALSSWVYLKKMFCQILRRYTNWQQSKKV